MNCRRFIQKSSWKFIFIFHLLRVFVRLQANSHRSHDQLRKTSVDHGLWPYSCKFATRFPSSTVLEKEHELWTHDEISCVCRCMDSTKRIWETMHGNRPVKPDVSAFFGRRRKVPRVHSQKVFQSTEWDLHGKLNRLLQVWLTLTTSNYLDLISF